MKGLRVSITYKLMSNKDIITTIEDTIKDLEKEEADTICAKISLTIQNSKPSADSLFKEERNFWKNYNMIHQL